MKETRSNFAGALWARVKSLKPFSLKSWPNWALTVATFVASFVMGAGFAGAFVVGAYGFCGACCAIGCAATLKFAAALAFLKYASVMGAFAMAWSGIGYLGLAAQLKVRGERENRELLSTFAAGKILTDAGLVSVPAGH